jgi:CheY-like chemotaxis protein
MSRILLVEDEKVNRDILARRLVKQGYVVQIAVNGVEACAAADAAAVDLILMDAQMPEMDGYEAIRRLKAAPQTQKIPIIALTAHVMREERDKALASGCDDFHGKPVEFDKLLQQIDTALQKKDCP